MHKTEDTLRQRLEAGERDFEAEDLGESCHDLRDMNLEGVNFSRVFLVANLQGANLSRATFIEANIKTCNFSGSDLRRANLSGAAIDGAVFTGARLEGALFDGASEQGHVYASGELPWSI
jgi:uncharacterized protein YjbI with pentapeptide repeats